MIGFGCFSPSCLWKLNEDRQPNQAATSTNFCHQFDSCQEFSRLFGVNWCIRHGYLRSSLLPGSWTIWPLGDSPQWNTKQARIRLSSVRRRKPIFGSWTDMTCLLNFTNLRRRPGNELYFGKAGFNSYSQSRIETYRTSRAPHILE